MVTAKRRSTAAEYAELIQERAQLRERLDVAVASRDALAASLRAVLALDDPKQHRWPAEQQVLRDAQALVAELASKERG